MADNTPPYNAAGRFVLRTPFQVPESAVFVCEAIDGFEALEHRGVDVYETYYKPKGLSEETYRQDRKDSINIITLMSDTDGVVNVPSSYIKSFPNAKVVPYNHTFATFDLGVLPDKLDFDATLKHAQTIFNNNLGVNAKYTVQVLAVTGQIDLVKHQQLEHARQIKIKLQENPITQRDTLLEENRKLRERVKLLEEKIIVT